MAMPLCLCFPLSLEDIRLQPKQYKPDYMYGTLTIVLSAGIELEMSRKRAVNQLEWELQLTVLNYKCNTYIYKS